MPPLGTDEIVDPLEPVDWASATRAKPSQSAHDAKKPIILEIADLIMAAKDYVYFKLIGNQKRLSSPAQTEHIP